MPAASRERQRRRAPVPKRQIGMVRLKEVAMPHALRGFVELMGLDKNDIDK